MIIEKICSKFNITEGEITAACDGMDAIIMAMEKYTSFSTKPNHFDVLSAIDAKLKRSQIQWNWRHVKGNQDDQVGTLYRWASLNVKCDTASKKIWFQYKANNQHITRHKVENEICRLYSNVPISSTRKQNTDQGKNISIFFVRVNIPFPLLSSSHGMLEQDNHPRRGFPPPGRR